MSTPAVTPQDGGVGQNWTAALVAILVILVLVLIGVSYFFVRFLVPAGLPQQTATAGGMTWVRSIYGYGPSAGEQLLGPTAVAVAPNGTIYATDPQRARVLAFNPDGTFRGPIQSGAGGAAKGQIGRPADVAVDADGFIYISDFKNGKVLVFDDRFAFVREWKVPLALGITVTDETVYVRSGGEVIQYGLDGIEKSRAGKRGRGTGAAIEPAGGITADAERIYVADALNRSIKAFDPAGSLLWVTPKNPSETSSSVEATAPITEGSSVLLDLPQDVVLDAAGRLVAVDAFNFSVLVMNATSGAIENSFGQEGTGDGQFVYPSGLAYDAKRDWFVVADTSNNRLQIVRIEGSGGGGGQAASRALSSPFRVCVVPLAALLAALAILFATRRRTTAS
ncbi:MAG: NHL repeat-containing protein [Actinomycetota bacterium]|nr:NHL repeat-containing protein [Actinomycetota bacterium]MDP3631529.1 NHL repeat-containing protein [Actinomycetota bacterium]